MAPKTKTVVYKATDLNTLDDLQSSCNRDEAFLGKVISIDLVSLDATDGPKATSITYEKVPLSSPINIGHLTFRAFTDDVDAANKTQILNGEGATPVLPGSSPDINTSRAKTFIQTKTVKFLVFRAK